MPALVSPSPAAAAFLPRTRNPAASPGGTARAPALLSRHHLAVAAAAAATGDHWGADHHQERDHYRGGRRGAGGRAGPSVQCDVDVVSWRERRVFASVAVGADVDSVRRIITDYERLADFVPNLVHSGRIPCPHEGRVWLEQRGLQQALYWHIEARVVLDLREVPDAVNGRELHFSMVDGDFKKFEGKWSVRSGPRVIPNLAISRIILRDNNKVRILQERCKGLLYMVLHARVVMDLCEKLEREICFEQVEGDFYSFKGKWHLEQLGDQHTLLKYMVETKMHKDTFLSESILEEVIYEDLPSNLCAIRDYVEKVKAERGSSTIHSHVPINPDTVAIDCAEGWRSEQASVDCSSSSTKQRPKVPGLQKDIEVLKSELGSFIAKYGQNGFMPKRKHLRTHGRVDIEKAITRMGGFRKIASIMNLALSYKNRKPRGYLDNLENLQEEIRRFQKNWGMDPSYMPSRKSFERAGRYDIARALEKWGGIQEVSRLLSLEPRRARKRAADPDCERQPESPPTVVAKHPSKPDKPSAPLDAQKWLLKLKDLDVNWVEY